MSRHLRIVIGCTLGMLVLATFGPALLGADGQTSPPPGGTPPLERLLSLGALCAVVLGVAEIVLFHAAWDGRVSARRYLLATWALSVGLTFSLLAAGDAGGFSLAKATYFQGYAQDAARFDGPLAVLAEYNTKHSELLPHSRTHPPGPVLLAQGEGALATRLSKLPGGDLGFSSREVASLALRGNLAGGLLILLAWSWLWPLHFLVRRMQTAGRPNEEPNVADRAGLVAVAMGATLPSLLLVAPLLDILFPSLVLFSAALSWKATAGPAGSRRFGLGLGAGLSAACLVFFGFGNLIALPILALVATLATLDGARANARRIPTRAAFETLGAALLGLLAAYVGLACLGYDFAEGLMQTLSFHDAGVNQVRAYGPSLLASPYTFALWLGAPILLGAGAWLLPGHTGAAKWLSYVLALLLALLVISGTTRGETERLWLVLTPFLVCLAGLTWAPLAGRRTPILIAANLLTTLALFASTGQYA